MPAVSASVCRTRCSFTGARSTSAARTSRRGCWRSSPTPRRWRRRHPRAMTSKPPLASVSLGCTTSTTSTTSTASASSSAGQGFMASVLHFCPDGRNAPILSFCPFFGVFLLSCLLCVTEIPFSLLNPRNSDIQCFTVKPKLDLPSKFHRPVSEQIVRWVWVGFCRFLSPLYNTFLLY